MINFRNVNLGIGRQPLQRSLFRRRRRVEPAFFFSLLTTLILLPGNYWLTAIGLGLATYLFIQYVEALGKELAILEIMALIAAVQWIVGPFISFNIGEGNVKYRMYVSEVDYMNFVVPALVCFVYGMRLVKSEKYFSALVFNIRKYLYLVFDKRYAFIFILVGIAVDFIAVPAAFRFIMYFVSQLKYIGVLYLIMKRDKNRWKVCIAVILLTLLGSIDEALFHGFILWSAFIFSFVCLEKNFSRKIKYLFVIGAVIAIVFLQGIKNEYRTRISDGNFAGTNVSVFVSLLANPFTTDRYSSINDYIRSVNDRFNQGWIVSSVIAYVPQFEDYAKGDTVIASIKDSLLPRFLVKKRTVHVRDNFMKYTGLYLGKTTSMGVSVLGEAYINFGVTGGVFFMFVWGVLIGYLMKLLLDKSRAYPTLILWVPLVFLQVVKAETELVVVMNHAVKSLVFIFIFYWFTQKILKWKV